MSKLKISIVSYLNSKIFLKGLIPFAEKDFEITLDIPSACAEKLINNSVDIGLIPVAVIPEINNASIISNYCISATNAVNSVFLFSNDELKSIHTIYLDPHSRTSNLLCKILADEYWQLNADFKIRTENIVELKEGEALVLIGDRTFDKINNYKTIIDLSEHWHNLTGLPFVFAAWVANKNIDATLIKKFNTYLSNGFNFLDEVIVENKLSYFDVDDYLRNKIEYNLTDEKRKAIELFLAKTFKYN